MTVPPTTTTPSGSSAAPTTVAPTPTRSGASRTPEAPRTTTAARAPTYARAVEVFRSGGFAGVSERLLVDEDGRWTYTSNRKGRQAAGTLTRAQRDSLQALLNDPALEQEAKLDLGPRCPDAFTYGVVSGATWVGWTDCGKQPPRTAQKILSFLAGLTPL
jgi:hypothetical protein